MVESRESESDSKHGRVSSSPLTTGVELHVAEYCKRMIPIDAEPLSEELPGEAKTASQ